MIYDFITVICVSILTGFSLAVFISCIIKIKEE